MTRGGRRLVSDYSWGLEIVGYLNMVLALSNAFEIRGGYKS